MKTASRKNHTSRTTDSSDSLIRSVEYIGDSLIIAAAKFANAKSSVHVGDWHGAKKLLEDGFAEFSIHSQHRDANFGTAGQSCQCRAKKYSRKRGG